MPWGMLLNCELGNDGEGN